MRAEQVSLSAFLVFGSGRSLACVGGARYAGLLSSGRARPLLRAQAIGCALEPEQNVSKALVLHNANTVQEADPLRAYSDPQLCASAESGSPTAPWPCDARTTRIEVCGRRARSATPRH
jgi:hypothetical protein